MIRLHSSRRVVRATLPFLFAIIAACSSDASDKHGRASQDGLATIHPVPRDGVGAGGGIDGSGGAGVGGASGAAGTGASFRTTIVSVDNGENIPTFDGTGVEILGGHHIVRATVSSAAGGAGAAPTPCKAAFDAVVGHDDELRGRASTVAPPVAFDVWDVLEGHAVGSSDPGLADCLAAKLDWGGGRWTEADRDRSATRVSATFVPAGETLAAWRERVELQAYSSEDVLGLAEVKGVCLRALESECESASLQSLDSTPGQLVFSFSGIEPDGARREGVTCLRQSGRGYHLLSYAVHGKLSAADADAWAARFKAAELLSPAF